MRSRSLLLLCSLCFVAGCEAPPPKEPQRPELSGGRSVVVDRELLRAFRGYVYSGYALVLGREQPQGADPDALRERQELARIELEQALVEAGAERARLERAADLVAAVRQGIERGGRYGLIARLGGPTADSVQVVRLREREVEREVRLFGQPFRYRVTSFDETLVADYARWRAEKLGQMAAYEVATYREDGLIHLDLGAAREVGERLFLPQVEPLRATARQATPAAFVGRAQDLPQLLSLAKATLRWRSLEGLWSRISSRGRSEQLERFASDYAERAELRAVAELHALSSLRARNGQQPLDQDARQRLYELGSLSAIVHGEPLGQVADVLGLAVLSLDGPRHAPHFRAARRLVLDLVAELRGGPVSDRADAEALAALAHAAPERLRELARALHRARGE